VVLIGAEGVKAHEAARGGVVRTPLASLARQAAYFSSVSARREVWPTNVTAPTQDMTQRKPMIGPICVTDSVSMYPPATTHMRRSCRTWDLTKSNLCYGLCKMFNYGACAG